MQREAFRSKDFSVNSAQFSIWPKITSKIASFEQRPSLGATWYHYEVFNITNEKR